MSQFDVIVVGARLAGAATALLLARSGVRVVVLDRARFPSDTLSSHQLQPPGADRLARWGLLDRLVAAGVPAARHVRFDAEGVVLESELGAFGRADGVYSPRRTTLDALLVDAARDAGAEVVEEFDADTLITDGGSVTGVRGHERGGRRERTFHAPLVVGADGKHSWTASAAGASVIREDERPSAAVYTYWQGLALEGGEMYGRPGRLVGAWPTQDGLTVTFVGMPRDAFERFRREPDAALLETFDAAGDLGERARAAQRVAPVRGTTDLPNRVRASAGPGWALAGDAGLVMDPVTGQGMGHALEDAENLAAAIVSGEPGALERYQAQRDQRRLPMYRFTLDLASHARRRGGRVLFEAIAADPSRTSAFLEVLAGVRSPDAFFAPRNVLRMLGWRGLARMARAG